MIFSDQIQRISSSESSVPFQQQISYVHPAAVLQRGIHNVTSKEGLLHLVDGQLVGDGIFNPIAQFMPTIMNNSALQQHVPNARRRRKASSKQITHCLKPNIAFQQQIDAMTFHSEMQQNNWNETIHNELQKNNPCVTPYTTRSQYNAGMAPYTVLEQQNPAVTSNIDRTQNISSITPCTSPIKKNTSNTSMVTNSVLENHMLGAILRTEWNGHIPVLTPDSNLEEQVLGVTPNTPMGQSIPDITRNTALRKHISCVNSNLQQHIPGVLTDSLLQQYKPNATILNDVQQGITGQRLNTAQQQVKFPLTPNAFIEQHVLRVINKGSSSASTLFEMSKLAYPRHPCIDVGRCEVLQPIWLSSALYPTLDLYFADMFWHALKDRYRDFPLWEMSERMRMKYHSLFTSRVSSQICILGKKYVKPIFKLLCALNCSMENAPTADPNQLREVFLGYVRTLAKMGLTGYNKKDEFLLFSAYVKEMFMSCTHIIHFPVNMVILSVVEIICIQMNWKNILDLKFAFDMENI